MDENSRIETLRMYELLDTPKDQIFDQITKLATAALNVPIALISLVDTDRIWFKSAQGLDAIEVAREEGLCASVIMDNDVYIVEDARNDPRTKNNSLVKGDFGLQFYVGFPLRVSNGEKLGSLCIMDQQPRKLSTHERELLRGFAYLVVQQFEIQYSIKKAVAAKLGMSTMLKAIYESSQEASTFIDTELKIQYTNQSSKNITKKLFGKEEQIGDDALDYVLPEFKHEFLEMFQNVLKGKTVEVEKTDGTNWWRIKMNPVYNDLNKLVGVAHIVQNITNAKNNFLKLVKQNELLKHITWQQCHEVRGPVANILGFCNLLVDTNEQCIPEQKEYVNHLSNATKELDKIIHKIVAQTFERDI